MLTGEICKKGGQYHTCVGCARHLCISCFHTVHFGIGAPRAGRSSVCNKCEVILTWRSPIDVLAAVNRASELLRYGKFDSRLRNENYCKTNSGSHATQIIMDAIDNSKSNKTKIPV